MCSSLDRIELLEQPPLLVAQVAGHRDVHEHALVAAAEALEHGHALPLQDAHLAGLHAGRQLELDRPFEGLDRQRRAERGLHDRQVDLRVDVVPFADEARIGLHADEDVHVARAAAERARVPLAGDPDALPVVDAGGNVDVELAPLDASGPAPSHSVHGCSTISPRP